MYDTKALAYVMARGPEVFAINISMRAGDGVALPVAVTAAVAAMVPTVAAMTGQTVNVASAMVTATCLVWWEPTWPPTCLGSPESKPGVLV